MRFIPLKNRNGVQLQEEFTFCKIELIYRHEFVFQ